MIRTFLLLPLVLVGGCISLLPEPPPPPRTFVLEAQQVGAAQGARIDAVIAVAAPNGERTLLGSDLVWRSGDSVSTVAETQWSARAGDALQQMVVDTIGRQGRFIAATSTGEARAAYEIRWDVLDFEVREETMQARFAADVRLMTQGRRIIASRLIEIETPVASRSASVTAQALARAAREGSARIGEFAAEAAALAESADADDQANAASINR